MNLLKLAQDIVAHRKGRGIGSDYRELGGVRMNRKKEALETLSCILFLLFVGLATVGVSAAIIWCALEYLRLFGIV